MKAATIMIQGTSSSAGKSLLTAALCRIYARRGLRVAPFKAQNMSNNAAVCAQGGEIGRAQALQAGAARIEPRVEMNPILIKPEADARSQVVVLGRPWRTLSAGEYYRHKDFLWGKVTGSLDRLREEYDLVVIEGAGSPAELNLREGDIVNMAVARYARSPVLLVGDLDRGGIFAQLLGTLWLLEPEERALVRGLVINKFRGDLALFAGGVQIIESRGGVPVLGVVPYLKDLNLPEEDAVALDGRSARAIEGEAVDIAVLRLPHIANFDDFDPLQAEAGVRVRYVTGPDELGEPAAIVVPGTKSTMADLDWMRRTGLADAVTAFAARGGALAGICGGYQILGANLRDPRRVESDVEETAGLGLLPVDTEFLDEKAAFRARARITEAPGWLRPLAGIEVEGYEIHMGATPSGRTWLEIERRNGRDVRVADGAMDAAGRVWGCYLHGLFANEPFRHAWLRSLGWGAATTTPPETERLDRALERLADSVEAALDMKLLERIPWEN